MKVITRQLTKEILFSTLFVLTALIALFAFFDLMGQMDRIGSRYTFLQAFWITALTLPMRVYEVMPIAALIGAIFVMSQWAARSEFTILRVAGLSPMRLAAMLMVPGIILVGMTYVFGEFIAPPADAHSREYKAELLHRKMSARGYRTGSWVREVVENPQTNQTAVRYINVGLFNPNQTASQWHVLEFDKHQHLTRVISAQSGRYVEDQGWILRKAETTTIPSMQDMTQMPVLDTVKFSGPLNMMLETTIKPNIFSILTLKPEDMSMMALSQYVDHLKQSKQEAGRYEISLWNKVFYPLAVLVMIALSMPFAYMNTRSGGISIKIFGGLMIGLGYYTVNNLFSYLGMLNTWPPLLVALVPTTLMLIFAMVSMWYVEKR